MKKILLINFILFSLLSAISQPANDICDNAYSFGSLTSGVTQTYNGNASGCTQTFGSYKDVWVSFTVPCDGMNVRIDFCGSSPVHNNTYINVFTDCSLGSFFGYSSANFTSCGDGNVSIWWTLNTGTYIFPILIETGWETNYTISITGTCPPPNTFTHPTSGLQGTYLGNCMVNLDCDETYGYYDDGGPAANYSNTGGNDATSYGYYRTFCPDTHGKCIKATVNSMNIWYHTGGGGLGPAGCKDWLFVQNGPTQTSPNLWVGCRTLATPVTLNGAFNGGVWTSTSPSGCLTFAFHRAAATNARPLGWDITLECVDCAGHDPQESSECEGAIPTCGDLTFTGSSTGPGLSSTCTGCMISENFTTWYYFEITQSGTLYLTIEPINTNDDYDFVIFQTSNCSNLGPTVRCSYAMNTGNTGLADGYFDTSEDVGGDAWLAPLNVTAGNGYLLVVNGWTDSDAGYTLNFNLTGGAEFEDCDSLPSLPVEILNFDGYCQDEHANLQWTTASETNNDYFTVLKSYNGYMFKTIGWVFGQGNSNQLTNYQFTDNEKENKKVYYQLKQTDFNGEFSYSKMISIECGQITEFNMTVADNTDNGYIEALFDAIPHVQYNITLIDATGRTVYNETISGDDFIKHKISIETLAQGIYVLNVQSQANSHTQKVMIK